MCNKQIRLFKCIYTIYSIYMHASCIYGWNPFYCSFFFNKHEICVFVYTICRIQLNWVGLWMNSSDHVNNNRYLRALQAPVSVLLFLCCSFHLLFSFYPSLEGNAGGTFQHKYRGLCSTFNDACVN